MLVLMDFLGGKGQEFCIELLFDAQFFLPIRLKRSMEPVFLPV